MLQNVRIIPVEASRTGNVSSVIRTMGTVGLTSLWLVNPLMEPNSQTTALATGASDVTDSAHIVGTPDGALAGCSPMVGVNARSYTLPWPTPDPRKHGLRSIAETTNTPMALVSGHECVGLTNKELQKCHYHVAIVANSEYNSLNPTMTVQVIAYEVCMAWLVTQENDEQVEHEETPYPLIDDLGRFHGHLEQTLLAIGFVRENYPGQVANRLRRLFIRVCPESQESNILRGIPASIEQQNKGNEAE